MSKYFYKHKTISANNITHSQYASPDSDDNEDGKDEYNEEENRWHAPSKPEKKNSTINDLTISNSFLDPGSKFGAVNDATIKALEWENDKQSDFAIKNVPVSIKDKAGKTVTVSGNFARINNGEPEPMLCLEVNELEQQVSDMHNGEDLKKNA
ncbi:hypothetical protein C2G38_2152534 [Gigaspora rosea]|uniref:Uncharacterized protein n=1 Tax=Gigaspora rosea TaxID=44941 RepID=A0A397W8V2_9GLOM|nr:hypothetical protein C2G38_2152534 [Gigaspora rosea]